MMLARYNRKFAALLAGSVGLITLIIHSGGLSAADIAGGRYKADIAVVNSSFAAADNAVPFTLSTQGLVLNKYIQSDCSNVALTDGEGNDVVFMPAPGSGTAWLMWVDDIQQNHTRNYSLHMGGDVSGGILRWFPGINGMTVNDAASLEPGNNFEIEIKGYFDVNGGGYFAFKTNAITIHNNLGGTITTRLLGAPATTASQTTVNTVNALFAQFWAAQTFTASHTGELSSITLNLTKFGAPNYTVDVLLYNASGDLPTTLIGTICTFSSTLPTGSFTNYQFTANPGLPLVSGSAYAVVVKSAGGDSSNRVEWSSNSAGGYSGGRFASSNNSGGSWTGSAHDRGFAVEIMPVVTSVASGLTSGEHTLRVAANGTNLTTHWDGVQMDSDALGGYSAANNAAAWMFCQSYSVLYAEYIKASVGGVLRGHWYWQNAASFADRSGNGNTAAATFRTTSTDADLAATIHTLIPTATAAMAGDAGDNLTGLVPTTVTQPMPTVSYENWSRVPGGAVILALLDVGDIPPALFFVPLMTVLSLLGAFVTYHFTRDMLFTGLVGNFIIGMFIAMDVLYIIPLLLGVVAWVALLVKRRTISL